MPIADQLAADEDADIVIAMIREVLELGVGITTDQAAAIERRLKERYGDQRVRVKKKLQLSESNPLRAQVYRDGLTNMSNEEITRKHGVSRATIYRWMKAPPRSGG